MPVNAITIGLYQGEVVVSRDGSAIVLDLKKTGQPSTHISLNTTQAQLLEQALRIFIKELLSR